MYIGYFFQVQAPELTYQIHVHKGVITIPLACEHSVGLAEHLGPCPDLLIVLNPEVTPLYASYRQKPGAQEQVTVGYPDQWQPTTVWRIITEWDGLIHTVVEQSQLGGLLTFVRRRQDLPQTGCYSLET